MSHGDHVEAAPEGFSVTATTDNAPVAAFEDPARALYGIQGHPEVHHSEHGAQMLENFLYDVCGAKPSWTMAGFRDATIARLRERGARAASSSARSSGGVDSTVAAVLLREAVGDRFRGVFVDTGLLRKNEGRQVLEAFRHLGLPVTGVDASERFFERPRGRGGAGAEAQDHRRPLHRRLHGEREGRGRRRVARAGHALPGRHRVRLDQGPVGRHQDAPQRRRPAREARLHARRAPARAVQGRGAAARRGARDSEGDALAAPVPGPGPRRAHPGRDHAGARADPAGRRRDLHRGAEGVRLVRPHVAGVRGAPAGEVASA